MDDYAVTFTDKVADIIDDDVLYRITPNVKGMSRDDPWSYFGGFGLAGFHFEDGLLHFGHHLTDINFKFSDNIDGLDVNMVETWKRFSRKTWVVSKHNRTKGVLECNKFFADDLGLDNVGDAIMVSRMFVLDPRAFKDSDVFTVIYQNPGDFMFGDLGHSVSGFGFISFAWNLVLKDYIFDYVKGEKDLARVIRKNPFGYKEQRTIFNSGVEPDIRSFTFMGTMRDNFIKNRWASIPAVHEMLAKCYSLERQGCIELNAEFMADDENYTPLTTIDAQCTDCGISCLFAMYVVKHTGKDAEQRQLRYEAICYKCAALCKKKDGMKVVSLISTFIAKNLQLM
jgi:hypothetical protein